MIAKPSKRPATIAEYIRAAPPAGRAHLRELHAILSEVAPDATQAMKWNTPFFIEPRFLFSYSACKAHCNLAPGAATLKAFEKELADYRTTANFLQMPYDEPVPAALVRRLAKHQLKSVKKRTDDRFW